MTARTLLSGLVLGGLMITAPGAADNTPATQPGAAVPKPATTADLGGADRYLTFVSTDKPIYRPGERVLVRGTLLNAATHAPLPDNQPANATVQMIGPKGDNVGGGAAASIDSVVGFGWDIPESMPGGEYTVKITYTWQGYAPAQRKFDIRAYRAPRIRSQIVFVREGYGPGDKVVASLHAERAEGGLPAGAKVTVSARVDDAEVWTGATKIDAKGNCSAAFELPKAIARGEGTLVFVIEDGGTVETASKTIPILMQTVDVALYPEGGDLVGGLPNRVYFQALRPDKKPADIAGVVVDSAGKEVAQFKSEHEGRGRFTFTPRKDQTYALKVTAPAGITRTFPLPAVKDAGAVIRADSEVYKAGQPVTFAVMVPPAIRNLKLTLAKREVEVASSAQSTWASDKTGVYAAQLDPKGADGVLTATLWDDKGAPLAERLVFVQPAKAINVKVMADQTSYVPGGKANLTVTTTDADGKPISAVVGLTVTDDSVLEMVDKREQAPRLAAMVLLEGEVKDLGDAQVYLDPANPKAALATDLLLGTQGWRRFATLSATDFMNRYGDDAKRVLAFKAPPPPPEPPMAMEAAAGGANFGGRPLAPAMAMSRGAAQQKLGMADKGREANKFADGKKDRELAAGLAAPGNRPAIAGKIRFDANAEQMGQAPAHNDLVIVREFAHDLRPGWTPGERSDFAETLYWSPAVKTDDKGQANVSFRLSDSITTFRVLADGFDKAGTMGAGTGTVQCIQPFYIEPKVPLEVTAGDRIELPIAAVNNTPGSLQNLVIAVSAGPGIIVVNPPINPEAVPSLMPNQRSRQVRTLIVGDAAGEIDLTITAKAGDFSDKVVRKLVVKPKGFPTQVAFGGLLEENSTFSRPVTVPASMVGGSMKTAISVYPSPVANLTEAVATLMREPSGCFEQTSSTSYPLTMAEQYFTTHQGVDPKLIQKAGEILARGYQHLVGFECKDKGYEWFGGAAPGHEALTAYGLMQFHDMQKAQLPLVDEKMIDRTRAWLLSRRDGKGGFDRNKRALDSFGGAPEATTNAYIVWALLESGEKGLEKETAAVLAAASASEDSYLIALGANVAALAGDVDTAHTLMDKLVRKQDKDGSIAGALTSITRSGGMALSIEATSLTVLAWLRDARYAGSVETAMKWLAESCKSGRYGSTQSTVLALKAIIAYDQSRAHPKAPGSVQLLVDDKPFGEAVAFDADTKEPLVLPDVSALLPPGQHTVAVKMDNGSTMPFAIAVEFNSLTPASGKECKVDLGVTLKDKTLAEGAVTEARVVVTNKTDKDAATPVAIVGIPGGLEVRHDQLKELVKAGTIDAYEVIGRDVVLYWRQIKAGAKVELPLSLVAAVPGMYTGPASRAYEYYTDEYKQWVEGLGVSITAKP